MAEVHGGMGTVGGEKVTEEVKSGRDKWDGGNLCEIARAMDRRDGRGVVFVCEVREGRGVDVGLDARDGRGYGVVGGFGN